MSVGIAIATAIGFASSVIGCKSVLGSNVSDSENGREGSTESMFKVTGTGGDSDGSDMPVGLAMATGFDLLRTGL
jgi:hypothetical protein